MRKWLVLACTLMVTGAAAQTPAEDASLPPIVPHWADIETVQVRAAPGPALWHITRGDSEVWILGMIGGLPKDVSWNSKPLAEIIKGSHAMILSPRPDINLLDISWFLVTHCCSFFRLDDGKLDDFLPEPTRVKLAAMRESVGGDAKLYQGDEPLGAASRLGNAFNKKYEKDLGTVGIMPAVIKIANDNKVPQQPTFRFDPIPIGRELFKLTPQQQRPCLEANMQDIERRIVHARPMAEAWAVGDVQGVKAHFAEQRMMECMVGAVRAFGAMQQNQVPAFVTAITTALNKPGKTFAVIDMGPLLRQGGVLDQLEAKGLTIEAPPQ